MNLDVSKTCTAFNGFQRLASGPLQDVAMMVKNAIENGAASSVFIYDDATGRTIDLDLRENDLREIDAPGSPLDEISQHGSDPRGPGRPRLGVIAREVTLLPRHWDWLNTQPGGASVALRKLVEEARRTSGDKDRTRAAQEAAYHFMTAIAGDLPGFEEAIRALFSYDRRKFSDLIAKWPEDVRDHAIKLAFADLDSRGR